VKDPEPDDLAPADDADAVLAAPAFDDPLRELLGAGGRLASVSEGYEERPAQLAMAETVAKALHGRRHAVIEAGTGTGKTLAYLAPAILSGLKVVVSTATKALQEQLVEKDLPLLQSLGLKFSFAVMKGRSNYLCHLRKEQFDSAPVFVSMAERSMYPKLRDWADRTQTGDRAELELPDGYVAWRDVSATAETCLGQPCPRYEACHVTRMRAKAAEADVVVVNHHLYFADIAVRRQQNNRAGVEVVPRHEAVILDEAHNLEEIATEFFGAQVSNYRVFDLCRDVDRATGAHPGWPADRLRASTAALAKTSEAWFKAVASLAPPEVRDRASKLEAPRAPVAPKIRSAEPAPALGLFDRPSPDAPRELAAAHEEVLARAVVVDTSIGDPEGSERRETRWTLDPKLLASTAVERDGLVEELKVLESLLGELVRTLGEDPELQGFARRTHELLEAVGTLSGPGEPGLVYWVEQRGRGVFLRASPVDVAGELARTLFVADGIPVVMTSATLSTGGDLSFFRRRVGLFESSDGPPRALETILASPFDYETQAALYLPRHLPDPTDPIFIERAVEEIAALVALARGRTFALFTSHRAMTEAHRRLAPRIPYRVLKQGDKPKGALLRDFREEPSVLFATQSFWEGVDVQGDALSMVIIDKLPFASPGDPLTSARLQAITDRGGSPFGEYQLPAAAISLKQGFGRLIRSRRDTGCVAILDRRLWTKPYGGYFRRSLPRCPTFDAFADVKHWWRDVRRHESQSPPGGG
jgi:ATP-dependent DNA helicase DinG